jgi:ligand-binding SRPBCC domain-containing protein
MSYTVATFVAEDPLTIFAIHMAIFETKVTVACPLEQAFDFFIRPANAVKLSPPNMGLQFLNAPEVLSAGSRLEFKIQGFGQVQTLVHEITQFVQPTHFVEEQVEGIFQQWVHEHLFELTAAGEVQVTDRIAFEPPSGLLGLILSRSRIQDHLEEGFYHRHEKLKKFLPVTAIA